MRSSYALAAIAVATATVSVAQADFKLSLFHHSDGESRLVNAAANPLNAADPAFNYGGIARFASKLDQLKTTAVTAGFNTLTLSNGDMYLPGPQLDATFGNPSGPFYDAIGQDKIGYDAMSLANHEFDYGPAFTRRYLDNFTGGNDVWVGANVDYSGEPALAPLIGTKLVKSTVKTYAGGEKVGIVGIMVPELPTISTPGGVVVDPNVRLAVQSEVDALTLSGVNKIVVMGQLQSITNDISLIPLLRNVDVVITGGGSEIVANPTTALVPGDSRPSTLGGLTNQYPLRVKDADNKDTLLVGTTGFYKYIGNLNIEFDASGNVSTAAGDAVRVADVAADATNGVTARTDIQNDVVTPVRNHVVGLDAQVIATTAVPLDGRRSVTVDVPAGGRIEQVGGVRRAETNLGNLLADALSRAAAKHFANTPAPLANPVVGLQNGGGIRTEGQIVTDVSRFDTFITAAFDNTVAVARGVSIAKLKQILEHSVSNLNASGGFGQWSGISFRYNYNLATGTRVTDVYLADGTLLIQGGTVVSSLLVDFVTNDFTFNGGDAYPLRDLTYEITQTTYQKALEDIIIDPTSASFGGIAGLGGVIDPLRYGVVPLDNTADIQLGRRIDAFIPEPSALGLLMPAALVLGQRARRNRA